MQESVFVDNRVSDISLELLKKKGYGLIRLPSFKELSPSVASHPDILSAELPDGRILMSKKYYDENENILHIYSKHIVLTDECPSGRYPGDVLFDALRVGNTLYGRLDAVSEVLKSSCKRLVDVKQGYARCSVAMLSDTCGITADEGLYRALTADGVDMLKIRPGHISLDGCDYGFIGGAGGRLDDGEYAFFGDLLLHPDGEEMLAFAEKHKIKTVALDSGMLRDHGGLVVIRK